MHFRPYTFHMRLKGLNKLLVELRDTRALYYTMEYTMRVCMTDLKYAIY